MGRLLAIDTDPGVDDALALMLAAHSPGVRVVLISTVAGNVPVSLATRNARRLHALLGMDASTAVASGSSRPLATRLRNATHVHGDDGLAGASALRTREGQLLLERPGPPARRGAVQRLIEVVRDHGEALTLVALGPLTNIALAMEQAPKVFAKLSRLVIMGGAIRVPGNITPVAEFNFHVDPLAAERVLGSGLAITLIPLDVTQQVLLAGPVRAADRSRRAASLAQLANQFIAEGLQGRWRRRGLPMHDPLAVAVALEPNLVTTASMAVRVETEGSLTAGQCVTDARPLAPADSRPGIDVALEVDVTAATKFIEQRLTAAPQADDRPGSAAGVAVVGGSNLDFTVVADRLPSPGETVTGKDLLNAFGGKGANQALAARRAGVTVHFFTALGEDAGGKAYRAAMRGHGIQVHEPKLAGTPPTGAALIAVSASGENQISVAPGANARFRWQALAGAECHLARCRVLVAPLEVPQSALRAAFAEAKRRGLLTILNAAPAAPIAAALRRKVDILVVNETEAQVLSGRPVSGHAEVQAALSALGNQGFATVVLTRGGHGVSYLSAESGFAHQEAFDVAVRDTTGAGDTFVGFLAGSLARGLALHEAIRLAACAGAQAVTKLGAQAAIPTLAQVEARLGKRKRAGR